jgi:Fe-S cluster biogenesis protein NfuA
MTDELARGLRTQIEAVLDRLRPVLLADGGNVELVGVDAEGVVSVVFQGSCASCPAQVATLRLVIESGLRHEVPSVRQVVPVQLAPD